MESTEKLLELMSYQGCSISYDQHTKNDIICTFWEKQSEIEFKRIYH